MRWEGRRQSENVEDRRGIGGPVLVGGGLITLLLMLAMMFLGIKGETRDLALLQTFAADATAVTGEGWSAAQLTTVGAVAARSKDNLQQALRAAQQAPANGVAAQP